jgi:hypothetical protein
MVQYRSVDLTTALLVSNNSPVPGKRNKTKSDRGKSETDRFLAVLAEVINMQPNQGKQQQ